MIRPTRAFGGIKAAVSRLTFGMTFITGLPYGFCSVELDAAVLIDLCPAFRLAAEVFLEFLGRRGGGENASFLQPLGHRRIGHGLHHVLVNPLDDRGRRSGRRDESDPA